jgi:uncharacterized protein YutE (UPF0331/DUF86 family)
LADRIARVQEHRKPSAEDLAASRDSTDLVSFNLMLAVQTCTDIASHLIADEGWPAAGTLGESFTRMEQHGVIASDTAASVRDAVGLRNVVAHGYSSVDIELLQRAATTGLADLDRFAREVASWVSQR